MALTPLPNSSFSTKLPSLQVYMDSSSLGLFKTCPRKYYYSIILGRQPSTESIHLTFGTLMHKALEIYRKALAKGVEHNIAMRASIKWVMNATWDREHNRPWSSGDNYKNRFTLARTIVWYLDKYQEDPLRTVILEDGTPAVELPFIVDSGYSAFTGEDFRLCGTLDRIVTHENDYFITDIKTTKSTIATYYFDRYSPDNQMTTYKLAGVMAFNMPVNGIIIEACQVAVEFSRFERGFIERSDAQLIEWQDDLGYWLMSLNHCAETNKWPRNDTACNMYGGCPFRPVCAQTNPTAATRVLEGAYKTRLWDPLSNRRTD